MYLDSKLVRVNGLQWDEIRKEWHLPLHEHAVEVCKDGEGRMDVYFTAVYGCLF